LTRQGGTGRGEARHGTAWQGKVLSLRGLHRAAADLFFKEEI